ncbi:unnamed protein product [Didymodactylos carnosus]|uniref:Uncharacterized protein n=1 Tax=Didymodactylos carnosus TaxID=1234261 RepID=A0A815R8U9_9BILA|nr:unnamed protein product [Didymodactylos carnosus]CAF1474183.1 unnamed protein product [Didymodactylos carnosus]CAF4085266.1 unnamed protein product [Didymodactylos carnosus]CAF4340891.1 unnamed protein product [Didymodactylos carnosus]
MLNSLKMFHVLKYADNVTNFGLDDGDAGPKLLGKKIRSGRIYALKRDNLTHEVELRGDREKEKKGDLIILERTKYVNKILMTLVDGLKKDGVLMTAKRCYDKLKDEGIYDIARERVRSVWRSIGDFCVAEKLRINDNDGEDDDENENENKTTPNEEDTKEDCHDDESEVQSGCDNEQAKRTNQATSISTESSTIPSSAMVISSRLSTNDTMKKTDKRSLSNTRDKENFPNSSKTKPTSELKRLEDYLTANKDMDGGEDQTTRAA